MYADYTYYYNDYGGTLTEAAFSRLSVLANAHINKITHNRAKTATGAELEAVKMAMCAVVDELDKQERGGIITSESNDGISRSYAVSSVVRSASQRIYDAAEVYLCGTNLLFAGV
jgi:hypothetical protein